MFIGRNRDDVGHHRGHDYPCDNDHDEPAGYDDDQLGGTGLVDHYIAVRSASRMCH